MRNPFRRQTEIAAPTLRDRAADLSARLAGTTRKPEPAAAPAAGPDEPAAIEFAAGLDFPAYALDETAGQRIEDLRRELRLDALMVAAQGGRVGHHPTAGGLAHGDGTVSLTAANGHVSRVPVAHWVAFVAQQMHSLIRGEISRRRAIEANHLPADKHAEWEAGIERELRSDAVHVLAFRHVRAFEAAQALRSGVEPASQELREKSDAELLALAPQWEAAMDLYQQRIDAQHELEVTATNDGWPGRAPEGSGPEWQAWFQQKEEWRERTGIAAAEEASSEAGRALHQIELKISDLSAASLAGLKLKARVAQYSDDIGVDWPENLGPGLARDILAMTETAAAQPAPDHFSLIPMLDLPAVTMDELRSIRELAERISSVAYAHTWGPRCQLRPNPHGAADYNGAGKLMQWIGDALTSVESAAEDEAKRRVPTDQNDREYRLAMLAGTIIDNGDPAETAAFARELLAMVEQ